jgi:hypothetical protein
MWVLKSSQSDIYLCKVLLAKIPAIRTVLILACASLRDATTNRFVTFVIAPLQEMQASIDAVTVMDIFDN